MSTMATDKKIRAATVVKFSDLLNEIARDLGKEEDAEKFTEKEDPPVGNTGWMVTAWTRGKNGYNVHPLPICEPVSQASLV